MAYSQNRREHLLFEREEPNLSAIHIAAHRGPIRNGLTAQAAQIRVVNAGRRDGSLQPIGRVRLTNGARYIAVYPALCIKPTDPKPFMDDEQTLRSAISAALDNPLTPTLPSGMPVDILVIFDGQEPEPGQWLEVELKPFVGTGLDFKLKSVGDFAAEISAKVRAAFAR